MLSKELLRSRIAFIRQGSEVERWHTKRMQQRNDVGHHSFHVAWLAYLMASAEGLTSEDKLRIVLAALSHDLAEQTTGDVPGDFKRELQLREQFGQYEQAIFREIGFDFWGELSAAEHRIVKMADLFDGAFFIVSEASFGNGRVGEVFRNYREYIDTYAPLTMCELAIVQYLDDLWAAYGTTSIGSWGKTAHKEDSRRKLSVMGDDIHEDRAGLVDVVRREEAEGRATAGPQSNAPEQGDAVVAEHPVDDAMDDRAQPDLADERPSSPANARQHGGDHYKGVGYEHWDLVLDTGMNYFQGCATKYVTRWRKHEAGETNLLKAIHYCDKLEEAQAAGRIKPEGVHTVSDIISFSVANGLNELETQVIKDIVGWRLDNARKNLQLLREGHTELERTNTKLYYGQNN